MEVTWLGYDWTLWPGGTFSFTTKEVATRAVECRTHARTEQFYAVAIAHLGELSKVWKKFPLDYDDLALEFQRLFVAKGNDFELAPYTRKDPDGWDIYVPYEMSDEDILVCGEVGFESSLVPCVHDAATIDESSREQQLNMLIDGRP